MLNSVLNKTLLVFLSTIVIYSCNISNEDNCSGSGGIIVDEQLYNNISVAVGETFMVDLLGSPPLFTHPNNVPITVTSVQGGDPLLADVLLDPNIGDATLIIIGKKIGEFSLRIRAVDDCSGDLNPVTKLISVTITN